MSSFICLFHPLRRVFRLAAFLVVFLPFSSVAQLWTGNLGSPVLNVNFGAGNSQALPSAKTSFTYSKGCPSPGNYSLEHFLFGCASNNWVVLTGDHTGNFDGNYMLVNAKADPGTVFVDTVTNLCGNTNYQFSGWLTNSMRSTACNGNPVLPNITFSIENITGTVLASFNTGDLPVTGFKDWLEYGVCYKTAVTPIPLVVRIKSNTGSDCGAGFVLDDVTVKPGGPAMAVSVNGDLDVSAVDLCSGYTHLLILQTTYTTGFNDPLLQWQNSLDTGITWHDIPGATTATYAVPHRDDSVILFRMGMSERTNAGINTCKIYTKRIWTSVYHVPDHDPLKQVLGCLNKDLLLVPAVGFLKYQWKGPNGFISNEQKPVVANIAYADAGLYLVTLTADFGCTAVDTLRVNISPSTTITTQTLYNICEGTTVNLSATGDGAYAWSPATGLSNANIANPVVNPADSIQYKVVLTNSYGCKDSATVVINVFKKISVDAGPDKKIVIGDTVLLNGLVKGTAVNYYWTNSPSMNNPLALQPAVFPSVESHYTLNVVSTVGCGNASSEVIVTVYKDIFIPNAFSPNGDGKNDMFRVFALDSYELISFDIFNRWGSKVFSTTNTSMGWNGMINGYLQETGVYVYYLEIRNKSGKTRSIKGSVLLVR
jgi:gliding motility-associated-like protein